MILLYSTVERLIDAITPVFIIVILPVAVVWLVSSARKHEIDKRAEVLFKAIETGCPIDQTLLIRPQRSLKERLLTRFTVGLVLSLIGIGWCIVAFIFADPDSVNNDPGEYLFIFFLPAVLFLATGIGLVVSWLIGRKQLED
jgi:hypothetical protein